MTLPVGSTGPNPRFHRYQFGRYSGRYFDRKDAWATVTSGVPDITGTVHLWTSFGVVSGYRKAFIFPERVFIREIEDRVDSAGNLTDPASRNRLRSQACRFLRFAGALVPLRNLFHGVPEPG